jgi:dedicator of cytokinesis protein 3
MTLRLHADVLDWDAKLKHSLFPVADDDKEPATKESIYLVCIQLFCQGGAWERAIDLSNNLKLHYETMHSYQSQADNLQFQATLYRRIVTEERFFPSYYRVIFHGKGFGAKPKQYIYKGKDWEQIGTFCERMRKTYACEIITSTAPVEDEITNGDGKHLQICAVQPAPDFREWCKIDPDTKNVGMLSLIDRKRRPDQDKDIFPLWLHEPELKCDEEVDETSKQTTLDQIAKIYAPVTNYYRNNEIYIFSCSRPIRKTNPALQDHPAREFLELYTEKIVVYTQDSFPCQARRSQIKQVISSLIKPIENAIITTRTKTKQLREMKSKYSASESNKRTSMVLLRRSIEEPLPSPTNALSVLIPQPSPTPSSNPGTPPALNTNPFTLALKGAICAPVNGGIPMYKSAFLTDVRTSKESGATPSLCAELENAITEQAEVVSSCLLLHANLVTSDMKPLHDEMVNGN